MLVVLLQLVAAPATLASPGAPAGFAGIWKAIDCAQWWEDGHVDCSIWGDGSDLRLSVTTGEAPRVTFQDVYASFCANNGAAAVRWVAAGYGMYEDIFLWLTFTKSGCGAFGKGGYGGIQLYHDPGSDTLWEDEDGDGWGIVWNRAT